MVNFFREEKPERKEGTTWGLPPWVLGQSLRAIAIDAKCPSGGFPRFPSLPRFDFQASLGRYNQAFQQATHAGNDLPENR